jgi:D-alanine-D-alanine ligase
MTKINKLIEIVSSSRRGLSSMSIESRESVQAVLAARYTRVRLTTIDNLSDLEALAARAPDLVFLGMKYIPVGAEQGLRAGSKLWVSQFLDDHGIAYTGSGGLALELELNKELAKQRVLEAGLQTPRFRVVRYGQPPVPLGGALRYPVFIKPTNRGAGIGIDSVSLAHDFEQLCVKIQSLTSRLQADSLIEEYLPGREFSVGILKDIETGDYAAMPIELVAPADACGVRILSAAIKSADTERSLAVTDETLRAELSELALDAFQALGARDYGRIDIRLDSRGTPHFLEANLLPSLLNHYGNFPKACLLNLELDYKAMIFRIVQLAFSRAALFQDESFARALSRPPLAFPGAMFESV